MCRAVADVDAAGDDLRLEVSPPDDGPFALSPERPLGEGELFFPLDARLVGALGPGRHPVDLVLAGADAESEPYPYFLDLTDALPIALTRGPSGDVHRNEVAVLEGDGFLEEREGTVEARFVGTFTPGEGAASDVDASLPVELAERGDRSRGLVTLGAELGGVGPGTFEGTLQLASVLAASGARTESDPLDLTLAFLPPEVFGVDPETVSLEQIVRVRGAGFLGGDDGTTSLLAAGSFTPEAGVSQPVPESELILAFVSGSEVAGPIRAMEVGGSLVSELFGAARGRFEGTLTPLLRTGEGNFEGAPAPITLTLGPLVQVVWVRFLPGFYDSLARFGLAASAGVIEERIAARIESIYADWNVDVRLERPTDFSASGYATVEVGGPDPNGRGLFGYDNTPGKDVGNVRLFDAIGGANAETQEDGYPGFGGVFVESLFGFSAHPPEELDGAGPDPDPLFDEIFDPVRDESATLAEVRGEGERAASVNRAIDALASVVGETAAHELGHSLGLADPYGSSTVFHNPGDSPGCLMDSGSVRPFGERASQPGFADTHLCRDAPGYLDAILPRE